MQGVRGLPAQGTFFGAFTLNSPGSSFSGTSSGSDTTNPGPDSKGDREKGKPFFPRGFERIKLNLEDRFLALSMTSSLCIRFLCRRDQEVRVNEILR
jgi:hypothetical protein